jgi:putrescine transport system substrate-binding protein
MVFDPRNLAKLKSCGVAFLDAPVKIIPRPLYLGWTPTASSLRLQAGVETADDVAAFGDLFQLSKYTADLANGDICVAIATRYW